jgi:ribosomal protein L34
VTAARLSADLEKRAAEHGYLSRAQVRAAERHVSRDPRAEQEYHPPTYQPLSPEQDRGHGPRLGF